MVKSRFLNVCLAAVIALALCLSLGTMANAQFLPASYYYTSPLAFPSYSYFNTIDGYLLGFNTFNPFLAPAVADAYTLAGIPVFGYLSNPYATAFPYSTLDVLAPYAPPVYPTFTYGAPDIYSLWLGLNL
ncbi:MAG: hypothetical protein ACMUJM_03345 [bacterium]